MKQLMLEANMKGGSCWRQKCRSCWKQKIVQLILEAKIGRLIVEANIGEVVGGSK